MLTWTSRTLQKSLFGLLTWRRCEAFQGRTVVGARLELLWGEICARCEVWHSGMGAKAPLGPNLRFDRRIVQAAGHVFKSTTQQDSLRKGKQSPTAHHCTPKALTCLTTFEPVLTQFSDTNMSNLLLFSQLVKNSGCVCPGD